LGTVWESVEQVKFGLEFRIEVDAETFGRVELRLIDQLQARVDNHQTPGKLVDSYGKRRELAGLSFPFSIRRQRENHP
jgi:hypothetical protein